MLVSRRGFFGILAGLAAAPVFAPLAKMFPTTAYTTYLVGKDAIVSWEPNKVYNHGNHVAVTGLCEPLVFRGGNWSKRKPLNHK